MWQRIHWSGHIRTKLLKFYTILFIAILILCELFSRLFFQNPLAHIKPRPHIPYYQSDINLGWKNNPGNYTVDFADGDSKRTIDIKIGNKGERLSYKNSVLGSNPDILFVGDSWTFGEAVEAEESFAGIVAKKLSKLNIVNMGVGGYSTYQTLLQLENLLKNSKPKQVVYGFLSFHGRRNIAFNGWVRSIGKSSQGRTGKLPYVRMNGKELKRQMMEIHSPVESVCEWSDFLCVLGLSISRFDDHLLDSQKIPVTEILLREMKDLVEKNGAKFTVSLLDSLSFRYESYLSKTGVDFLKVEGEFGRLSYDAHPDLRFHKLAAQRVLENVAPGVQK